MRADDDLGRENLCRYVLRHPISLQRLSMTRDGRVAYRVKYPRGNKTHLLMEPVQFLARLASLIPAPRHPLVYCAHLGLRPVVLVDLRGLRPASWTSSTTVRYFGVLSSASRWREHVVPKADDDNHQQSEPPRQNTTDVSNTLAAAGKASRDGVRSVKQTETESEPAPAPHRGCIRAATNYVDWATLLRRVFNIDALECPRCGGRLRFIATITEQPVIAKILDALGLPFQPPLPHARAPDPQLGFELVMHVA